MRLKKAAKIQGIRASGLSAMVADAKSKAVAKRAPPIKYLLDGNNPFRKKYGSEKGEFMEKTWVKPIQGEPAFASVVCIKYLVMHIVIKTRDFFQGTNHEDDWLFYHNTLSLLAAKDCIVWIKNAGARDQDPENYLFLLGPAPTQLEQRVPEI